LKNSSGERDSVLQLFQVAPNMVITARKKRRDRRTGGVSDSQIFTPYKVGGLLCSNFNAAAFGSLA
jgi:hypothetical protein